MHLSLGTHSACKHAIPMQALPMHGIPSHMHGLKRCQKAWKNLRPFAFPVVGCHVPDPSVSHRPLAPAAVLDAIPRMLEWNAACLSLLLLRQAGTAEQGKRRCVLSELSGSRPTNGRGRHIAKTPSEEFTQFVEFDLHLLLGSDGDLDRCCGMSKLSWSAQWKIVWSVPESSQILLPKASLTQQFIVGPCKPNPACSTTEDEILHHLDASL